MTKFNYKKWVTEMKYGKQPHLFEEEDKEEKPSSDSDKPKSDDKKDDKKDKPKKDDKKDKPKKDDKKDKPKKGDKPVAKGGEGIYVVMPGQDEPKSYSGTTSGGTRSMDENGPSPLNEQWSWGGTGIPRYYIEWSNCDGSGYGMMSSGVITPSPCTWPQCFLDSVVPTVGMEIGGYINHPSGQGSEPGVITSVTPAANQNGGATIMSQWAGTPCQTTSTGSASGSCFPIYATKCAGTGAPIGTQGQFPCAMIDGQPATQALVGQQVKHDGTIVPGGSTVWTVDSVDLNTDNGPNYQSINAFPNSSLTTQGAQCASTGSAGCDNSDFDVTASCADANLMNSPVGNIGGANSWTTWLNAQMNAFNGNAGCNQFGAIQNWTLAQIAPTANCPALPALSQFGQYGGENNQGNCHPEIGVKRKFAKAKWAYCMSQLCAGGSQAGC